jgi:hypothetical protein
MDSPSDLSKGRVRARRSTISSKSQLAVTILSNKKPEAVSAIHIQLWQSNAQACRKLALRSG